MNVAIDPSWRRKAIENVNRHKIACPDSQCKGRLRLVEDPDGCQVCGLIILKCTLCNIAFTWGE